MKKIAALVLLVLTTSCYGEWDIPKVPRRDPCFGTVEEKYVYVMPACRHAPPAGIPPEVMAATGYAVGSINALR